MADRLEGLLVIGDPHVEGRIPDFRSDNYPETILNKLEWCLDYARNQRLQPVLLGDLFDKPRDNPTWMIGRLIEMMIGRKLIGIYGNHDCAQPELTDDDSLMILVKSGCLQLVSENNPWTATIAGRTVLVGGSSYRQRIPDRIDVSRFPKHSLFPEQPFCVWLTHHDLKVGDYENGRFSPFAIPNVDLVINGHIHTRSEPVQKEDTTWMNPGNISRRSRSQTCREQSPAVLQIDIEADDWSSQYVEVPHREFSEVFHAPADSDASLDSHSVFVAGLDELKNRKTASGAGLNSFLEKNIDQFSEQVGAEIMKLATQVLEPAGAEDAQLD